MSNSEKVNIWEKVNVLAVVAGVIITAVGILYNMDKIKCFFNPQESKCSELCMKHTSINGTTGKLKDTGSICSIEDRESEWIHLGDDTGWKN